MIKKGSIMGKAVLIIILGAVVAGSVTYMQASQTQVATTDRQSLYQEEVLAREIARSAHGLAKLRLQQASTTTDAAVGSINGHHKDGSIKLHGKMKGDMMDGKYEVWAKAVDGQNIKLETVGIFNGVREVITSYYRLEMLVVKEPSTMRVEFIESMAGYCSAVYLQQYIPISPGDSTGAITGVVSADGKWFIKNPEMIFVAGHNRDGLDTAPADVFLDTGTRMNFFIGVDPNCSEEGVWVDTFDSSDYDWIHYALETTSDIRSMQEGRYSMIELHHSNDQQWRIAFEDLQHFSAEQHADIKTNGYGGSWDEDDMTYGGTGWGVDLSGYRDLYDYGWKPDYSDQVIEVTLTPCGGPCDVEAEEV